jgi:hypothetical protein
MSSMHDCTGMAGLTLFFSVYAWVPGPFLLLESAGDATITGS